MRRFFAISVFTAFSGLFIFCPSMIATAQTFQQLSAAEKQVYVKEKARLIGAAITGRPSDLSPAFLSLVAQRVDAYAERIGNNIQGIQGKEDLRLVLERGMKYGPAFARTFQSRDVSPLIGIYLPFMESEYRNELVSPTGSAGMFQFIEQTALRFGLAAEERNDPAKAADAAARYLSELQARFAGDMWLSLLAYNQGENAVAQFQRRLSAVGESRDTTCSICTLIEKKDSLGKNFQGEGAGYTPALVAAAIIGEHPRDFGIEMRPLSTIMNGK
jgi:membrane-bound lytic murein transglycosylase D